MVTVSNDVDSFQCHAGVSKEMLEACGNPVFVLYLDVLPYFRATAGAVTVGV